MTDEMKETHLEVARSIEGLYWAQLDPLEQASIDMLASEGIKCRVWEGTSGFLGLSKIKVPEEPTQ